MNRAFLSIFSAVALLFASGCGQEGAVYDAPVDKVYERLSELNLGKGHESAVFRYNDESLPVESVPSQSVSWFMGKNGKGTAVTAHLTDEGDSKTRVFIEVKTPDMGEMAMFKGFASNMIRERIASYLEERPYNDQKFVDAMYGGNASLIPKEIREASSAALKMDADLQRDLDEMQSNPARIDATTSVSRRAVTTGAPMIDTTKYNQP